MHPTAAVEGCAACPLEKSFIRRGLVSINVICAHPGSIGARATRGVIPAQIDRPQDALERKVDEEQ